MKKNHVLLIFFITFTNIYSHIYSQEKIFFSNNIHLFIANGEYELYYEAGGYNNEIKHFSPVVYEEYSKGKYKIIWKYLICTDSVTKRKYYFRYLNQCRLKAICKDKTLKGLIFELSTGNESDLAFPK